MLSNSLYTIQLIIFDFGLIYFSELSSSYYIIANYNKKNNYGYCWFKLINIKHIIVVIRVEYLHLSLNIRAIGCCINIHCRSFDIFEITY